MVLLAVSVLAGLLAMAVGVGFTLVACVWTRVDLDRLERVARIYRQHLAPRLFYRRPPDDDA